MQTSFIVFFLLAAGVLALFFLLGLMQKILNGNLKKRVAQRFDSKDIIALSTRANLMGVKSKGSGQVRGNGAMVLTRDNLLFIQAFPKKEFEIPINAIKKISLPRAFNGKSVIAKLLCVHYEINGQGESIAWAIKDSHDWKQALETLFTEN